MNDKIYLMTKFKCVGMNDKIYLKSNQICKN